MTKYTRECTKLNALIFFLGVRSMLALAFMVTSLSVHWVLYTECTDRDSHFHTSIPSVQIGTRKVGGVLSTITLQIKSHSVSPLIVLKLYGLMLCELVA